LPRIRQADSPDNVHLCDAGRLNDRATANEVVGRQSNSRAKRHENHVPVLLLIIALASLATMLWYRAFLGKYNQGLHNSVVENLNRLFPDSIVQIGSVSADGPDKIIVNNLRLASVVANPKRPIVTIHRVVLHGDLDIAHWVQKTTRVAHVDLHGVRIDVWRSSAGLWSIQTLQPHPIPNAPPPSINFQDTTLRLFSDAGSAANVLSFSDLQGRMEPVGANTVTAVPSARSAIHKPPMAVQLSCRSTGLLKRLELTGLVDVEQQTWNAEGSIDNLNFSPKLLEAMPTELSQYMSQLSGLECLASSRFRVASTVEQGVSFEVQGRISAGRLRDSRLPYPLDKLSAAFFCNNQILQLRSMRASSGEATLELKSDIMGFGRDVPMVIHAEAKNLEIDSRMRESLPASLREHWDRLQPAGRVDGDIRLTFDGHAWTPIASIHCEQVSIKPWLFPYPVNDIHGQIRYQEGTISSERLDGLAGGQPVSSNFSLSQQGNQWIGKLTLQSEGALAIDEPLLAALTPEGKETSGVERFVRSLRPRGTIQVNHATFEKATAESTGWHRNIDIQVLSGSIKYDHFRYPIHEIQGRIVGQGDNWWLHQFQGRNDSGQILCSGNWSLSDDVEIPFDLRFQATAVPIEEELQRALPKEVQYVWDELQPSGSIDRVEVQLNKVPGQPLTTRVAIEERSETNQQAGRSLRIQPKNFPLWLSDIDCSIQYEPGRVLIHQASGINGDSRLAIQGECQPQADGRWLADIQWLPRTRLIVDGQLVRALPKTIRDSLVRIDFRGPVGVLGRSQVLFASETEATVNTAWDCQLDIEDGQFGDGKVVGGLRGTLLATGSSDGSTLQTRGSVEMDALNVYGVPLTRLRGPYTIADNLLSFGSEVASTQPAQERQAMTADALTGQLTIAGVGHLQDGKLILNAELHDAELSGLLRDVGVEKASTQARCQAKVGFSGIPWNAQTWNGDGEIHLTDARLFQLPFMMRLMGTASVNADDDSAFQTADISFDIDGDKIPLRIQCEGDVLRLRGEGSINTRRDINLQMYTYIGRRPIYSMVSPLLAESRYATFMLIEVDGTLDNPNMQRRPFPQIEATLQQIFPEVAQKNKMDGLVPWR
jgi:hypothetical protein